MYTKSKKSLYFGYLNEKLLILSSNVLLYQNLFEHLTGHLLQSLLDGVPVI